MKDLETAGIKTIKLLQKAGFHAFWVGGVVRNILMKRKSDNLDIATDALPDEIEKILNQAKIKVKPVGKQFGSILAVVDKWPVEITTFRSEGRYSDKRHPDQVRFIKDYLADAQRRDFTINTLYYDPISKEFFDPTGKGRKDLKAKILRFVGDPKKRIDEDALRMLRGARLAAQLVFKLEKNSYAAIKTRAKFIQGVSGERIKAELDKIMLSGSGSGGIKLLSDLGLLKFIIPEFEKLKKFSHQSKLYHLEGTQFDHTLLALEKAGKTNLDLSYALLFHDIGKPEVAKRIFKNNEWVFTTRGHAEVSAEIFRKFARRIKFPKQSEKTTDWLIRNHMWMAKFAEMNLPDQYQLAVHPAFRLLIQHWAADEAGCRRADDNDAHTQKYRVSDRLAKKWLKQIEHTKSLVAKLAKGDLIMKYSGLKPGRQLGQMVDQIKIAIIQGKIKKEPDLKKFLQT